MEGGYLWPHRFGQKYPESWVQAVVLDHFLYSKSVEKQKWDLEKKLLNQTLDAWLLVNSYEPEPIDFTPVEKRDG